MKTIKINNAPKSMIMVLIENNMPFAYYYGNILIMGTSKVEKLKADMITKGISSSEIESLSYKVFDIDEVSDIIRFLILL